MLIVLAARLGVIYLAGDHWFGTLGVTTTILFSITWLSWRDRLGKFGQLFKYAFSHKVLRKATTWRIIPAVFMLWLLGSFSVGMHVYQFNNAPLVSFVQDIQEKNPEVGNVKDLTQRTQQQIVKNPVFFFLSFALAVIATLFLPVVDFQQWVFICGILFELYPWVLHLVDIALVEEIEVFTVLLFWNFLQRKSLNLGTTLD